MRVIVATDPKKVAQEAADIVQTFVASCASPKLGLATGGTMEGLFAELVRRYQAHNLSFKTTSAYLLDEYIGLARGDTNIFRETVRNSFVDHVDFGVGALSSPNPHASNLKAECLRYEQLVVAAQVGLQLLGIGSNGHIAFNEPGTPFDSVTRVVELASQTRADNARFFAATQVVESQFATSQFAMSQSVPTHAITQGIGTILNSSALLLVASGVRKAQVVAQALEGSVTELIPASVLQRHNNVTVILDELAASKLSG